MLSEAAQVLHRVFGYSAFYPAQEQAIASILGGRDTLVVMPTGGGKSLCYQVPALAKEGVTLVVSPLIALMKDQVEALERRGVAATFINSSLEWREQSERLSRMGRGEYKLVYVAPERLRNRGFSEALEQVRVTLLAVDEAHCISQWGHDFRPDYMRLRPVIESLGRPLVAAFTATATPEVRVDIIRNLGMSDPNEIVAGFERPNLRFVVRQVAGDYEKEERLHAIVQEYGTGIVYCATRKRVEAVAALLESRHTRTTSYHGGMSDEERDRAQNRFVEQKADVVVATNAFGMGIDRPDVRFVVHYEIPGSLEAYYQEAGRAGRDGQPAYCEMLFNFADTRVQEFFIAGANPGPGLIRALFDHLRKLRDARNEVVLSNSELTESMAGVENDMAVGAALAFLERAGVLERFDLHGKRGIRLLNPQQKSFEIPIDEVALSEKERRDRAKLRAVIDFAYATRCRQWMILDYFGEKGGHACGTCDICRKRAAGGEREPTPEEHTVVRKILSCIARMSRRNGAEWEARYGRGRLIQVLTGKTSDEVTRAGLNTLSTFGILAEADSRYLNRLLDTLAEGGLIQVGEEPYRLVGLSAAGDTAMRAEEGKYRLHWPEPPGEKRSRTKKTKATKADTFAETLAPEDEPLYELLRNIRKDQAKARGNVPAFQIFSDAVLRSLARLKPRSIEAALRIRGIGPEKARTMLPPFLEAIERAVK